MGNCLKLHLLLYMPPSLPHAFTERLASSWISAKGPDHQACHGPLRQRTPAFILGEASAWAQGQGRLCSIYRGEERYGHLSCQGWIMTYTWVPALLSGWSGQEGGGHPAGWGWWIRRRAAGGGDTAALPSRCLPHCPLAPASGLGVLPARPWLEASAGMAGLTLSTLLPGLVRLCAAGGVGQGKRCLPKPVLPAVTVCDNSGNMLPKNKYFSTCLLAHLVTLFVQIASLFPLALQLQRKREKQENLIT